MFLEIIMQTVFTLKFLQVLVSLFQILLQDLLSRFDKHQASLETQRGTSNCLPIKTWWDSLLQWRHCKNLLTYSQTTNTGFPFWEKEAPVSFVQQSCPSLDLRNSVCLRDRCTKQGHLDPCLGWHPKQYETSSQALGQIFPVRTRSVLPCIPFHSGTHRQAFTAQCQILWYSVIVIHEKVEGLNSAPKVFSINSLLNW